jgi:hypothetical protein
VDKSTVVQKEGVMNDLREIEALKIGTANTKFVSIEFPPSLAITFLLYFEEYSL